MCDSGFKGKQFHMILHYEGAPEPALGPLSQEPILDKGSPNSPNNPDSSNSPNSPYSLSYIIILYILL